MAQIAFIVNGKVNNLAPTLRAIRQEFEPAHQLAFYTTTHAGHSTELTEQAVLDGHTHLVCVGGDGSLNEVANGMMAARSKVSEVHWQQLRLGLIPMGTGNDYARSIRISHDLSVLKKRIEEDQGRPVDLGWVEYHSLSGGPQSRYFINITDIGMGGVVAEKLSRTPRWLGSTLAFQRAIISTLLTYRHQPVQVVTDSSTFEGNIMGVIIAKGKYFGGGLGIAPEAEPDSGTFSLVILGEVTILDYLRLLGKIKQCQRIQHSHFKYAQTREIEVNSPAGPLPIDMDGEFIGYSPLRVRLEPRALQFLCSA